MLAWQVTWKDVVSAALNPYIIEHISLLRVIPSQTQSPQSVETRLTRDIKSFFVFFKTFSTYSAYVHKFRKIKIFYTITYVIGKFTLCFLPYVLIFFKKSIDF